MVAQTITLPNIRKLFIPDPGFTLIEVDLQRADAQVVAWESNDESLKSIFRERKDIHTSNALDIFGGPGPISKGHSGYSEWDYKRHHAKQGVHAINYGCRKKKLSEEIHCSEADAQKFIDSWFQKHPQILKWHQKTLLDLHYRKCVENIFGYKRHYIELVGLEGVRQIKDTESLLPEALAWIAQSTVAITINKILIQIEEKIPQIKMLLQVHDSLLMQIETLRIDAALPQIYFASHFPLPYPDPLIIPPTVAISEKSWGDCNEIIFTPEGGWNFKEAA